MSVQKIFLGIVSVAVLSFLIFIVSYLSAGRVFFEALLLNIIFSLLVFTITLYLILYQPELYQRRLRAETSTVQIIMQLINMVAFFAMFIAAGLAERYNYFKLPYFFTAIGVAIFLFAFYIIYLVFRENRYLSSSISVEHEQVVISSGFYGYVRNPMYLGAMILLLSFPLILRSPVSFIPVGILFIGIVFRTLDEEKFLLNNLNGYTDYCKKVKYRLIPKIF